MQAAPLAILVPVLAATLLVAGGHRVPRPVGDLLALGAAIATTALCAATLAHVWSGPDEVYWFGGWHPRPGGIALGIDLGIDPIGAGAATLAALLMTAALVYSQRYFDTVAPLFHGLMLVFMAGMVGFALSGDLFNMFVFFELMSAPAYALAGYKAEERGPLQGALNFGITNSVGAFMTLAGIGLLYGRTGALNLAQIGASLHHQNPVHPDHVAVVGFVLVITGFLVKAAAVPFHFWLADAHATAPVPVCVLFSGIMVQLGLYGIARVYWTVFSGVPHFHDAALVQALLWLGVATALVGGVMAFLQRHLKRLLAFSTISHTGLFLVGLALLRGHGTSAVALFVVAHGLVKAALFMTVGQISHRLESVDELRLHGRGRGLWLPGALFAIGGLALASLPPFGPFLGKSLIEEAATERGLHWVAPVFLVASALAGGAVLRAFFGIFLGLGEPSPPGLRDEGETGAQAESGAPETTGGAGRIPAVMALTPVVLLVASLGIAFVPDVKAGFERAAIRFQDRAAYAAQVLHGRVSPLPPVHPATGPHLSSYLYGGGATLAAIAVALVALYLPRLELPRVEGALAVAAGGMRRWHSGHMGDYVTWLVVGVSVLGWALAAALT